MNGKCRSHPLQTLRRHRHIAHHLLERVDVGSQGIDGVGEVSVDGDDMVAEGFAVSFGVTDNC